MRERRKNERARCRLRCLIGEGKDARKGLIMDVSDGGLCLLSPVPFEIQEPLSLRIDAPKIGSIQVESMAWHVRRVQGSQSNKCAWSIGGVIMKSDEAYNRLLADAGLGENTVTDTDTDTDATTTATTTKATEARTPADDSQEALADELTVFKIRIKEKISPRTRLVSLTAKDEEQARTFAEADLDRKWSIVEVRRA